MSLSINIIHNPSFNSRHAKKKENSAGEAPLQHILLSSPSFRTLWCSSQQLHNELRISLEGYITFCPSTLDMYCRLLFDEHFADTPQARRKSLRRASLIWKKIRISAIRRKIASFFQVCARRCNVEVKVSTPQRPLVERVEISSIGILGQIRQNKINGSTWLNK